MRTVAWIGAAALLIAGAAILRRADAVAALRGQDELAARAKVAEADARATALRLVPGGQITEAELEEEDGVLLYSFDLQVDGDAGKWEVEIDAITGAVLSHEHDEVDDGEDHDEDADEHR